MYVRDSPVIRYRTRGFLQRNMAHRELRDTMGQGQPSDVTSPEECSAIGTKSPGIDDPPPRPSAAETLAKQDPESASGSLLSSLVSLRSNPGCAHANYPDDSLGDLEGLALGSLRRIGHQSKL